MWLKKSAEVIPWPLLWGKEVQKKYPISQAFLIKGSDSMSPTNPQSVGTPLSADLEAAQ